MRMTVDDVTVSTEVGKYDASVIGGSVTSFPPEKLIAYFNFDEPDGVGGTPVDLTGNVQAQHST
eukprot:GABW01004378.1.p2 GENE.GABW01004378.1~~GABW01004378.1.p2  ORF type:complete len:64 (-),score=23.18 GABW01004378.1:3-194(-)